MSSVGRNSMIMASGTAASRITGQIRTILLAAALGTTGLAANAYQAGSTIPQLIYALVSGGIFNAVLVPQIVRTLEKKDAKDRLNKLITFAITMLLAVTLLMGVSTPVITWLYAGGGPEMLALTNAFTLWCIPQIFFYGLYTVLGQILAAKGKFAMYAWSSVAANIVSCIGFGTFIALFGRVTTQPLSFWSNSRLLLTAGFWTLGVAIQALLLFIPLTKIGIVYKPSWGIKGIGLRSMGPVAAWSIGIVIVNQLSVMVTTHTITSAPQLAETTMGINQFDVAGNATFQNAYTIYLLPYSLIAVSVATAIFPKISKAVATHNIAIARQDLSDSLRHVSILMCFFLIAFVTMPTPISLALLPSISLKEAYFMSTPLMLLSFSLPFASAYLIIQRTFYAFEDGKQPFIFTLAGVVTELVVLIVCIQFFPPTQWVAVLSSSVTIEFLLTFPALIWMLRRRFNNNLDDSRLLSTHIKIAIATAVSICITLLVRIPVMKIINVEMPQLHGAVRWIRAILVCVILTVIIIVSYVGTLVLLKTQELTTLYNSFVLKVATKIPALSSLKFVQKVISKANKNADSTEIALDETSDKSNDEKAFTGANIENKKSYLRTSSNNQKNHRKPRIVTSTRKK